MTPNQALQPTLPLRGSSLGPSALGAAERRRYAARAGTYVTSELLEDARMRTTLLCLPLAL